MIEKKVSVGRPRFSVDFALILHFRETRHFGWYKVAREYTIRTGDYISKETCKRRYNEVTVVKAKKARKGVPKI